MRFFLCSIAIVLLLAGPDSFGRTSVTQQKDDNEVLTQGNPPLTVGLVDKFVEFFEWGLDSRFTKSQRIVFTTRLIQLWETRDQTRIEGLVNARKGYEQGRATATKEELKQGQVQIQAVMLNGFVNEPPGTLGELLISVYTSSHPDAAATLKKATPANPIASPTRVPAELVGEWMARRGSGSGYFNPSTGQTSGPNAVIDTYKIFADGTYEHAILLQSSLYNCTTTNLGRETGPITVAGSTFTITQRTATIDTKNTCSPGQNKSKQEALEPPETMSWRVERGEFGLQLCLRTSKNLTGCYLKQ